MYRYVATKTRVHRVVVSGGKAFRVPLCNLSDRVLLGLTEEQPAGTLCPHCWVDWEPPSQEESEQHQGCAEADPEPPEGAKPVSMLSPTKRLAAAALATAAVLGTAFGVIASPDLTQASDEPTGIEDLREDIGDLTLEINILRSEINEISGHTHEPSQITVIFPTPTPFVGPLAPPTPTPTPIDDSSSAGSSSTTTETIRTTETVVIPVPQLVPVQVTPTPAVTPTPTITPTPPPDPTPCVRPGKPKSGHDPCNWPAN